MKPPITSKRRTLVLDDVVLKLLAKKLRLPGNQRCVLISGIRLVFHGTRWEQYCNHVQVITVASCVLQVRMAQSVLNTATGRAGRLAAWHTAWLAAWQAARQADCWAGRPALASWPLPLLCLRSLDLRLRDSDSHLRRPSKEMFEWQWDNVQHDWYSVMVVHDSVQNSVVLSVNHKTSPDNIQLELALILFRIEPFLTPLSRPFPSCIFSLQAIRNQHFKNCVWVIA